MSKYEVGDIVKLHSGNLRMRVERVWQHPSSTSGYRLRYVDSLSMSYRLEWELELVQKNPTIETNTEYFLKFESGPLKLLWEKGEWGLVQGKGGAPRVVPISALTKTRPYIVAVSFVGYSGELHYYLTDEKLVKVGDIFSHGNLDRTFEVVEVGVKSAIATERLHGVKLQPGETIS